MDDLVQGDHHTSGLRYTRAHQLGAPPHEITVRELAERIIRLTASSSELVLRPLPEDDPVRRCPDIARAKKVEWEPSIDIDTGLKKTIEDFAQLLELPYPL